MRCVGEKKNRCVERRREKEEGRGKKKKISRIIEVICVQAGTRGMRVNYSHPVQIKLFTRSPTPIRA